MISNSTTISNNSVQNTAKNKKPNPQSPKFKGLMNLPGWGMDQLENGGFILSFLIQDTIGMTLPRSREGLKRDRAEGTKFKDLNFKEGLEVFIREFLSGPLMVFTPFVVFKLTKKFAGKSTFVNTELIKRMSKNLTQIVKNKKPEHTAQNIKENFYHSTIKEILESTTPNGKNKEATTDKILGYVKQLDELEPQLPNKKTKTLWQRITNRFKRKANRFKSEHDLLSDKIDELKNNIVNEFNSYHKANATNFEMVNKVKFQDSTFSTSKAIEAMRSYAYDASKNKNFSSWNEKDTEKFANKTMVKRVISTIAASFATIGATSIVPSIYALLNPVPPGALDNNCANPDHNHPKVINNTTENTNNKNNTNKQNLAFKGNILRQLQYEGNQVTPLLMTVSAGGGLVLPRVNTAIKRAPIDEDGKKNLLEVPEILTRDLTSIVAVSFGVPVLTKFMVNMYKKHSGFVLMNKPEKEMSKFKKFLDAINPVSSIEPFSIAEIKQIYGNINNKEQLNNFAEFINNNDGSLVKVFKKLANGKKCFEGTDADFATISKLDRKTANSKIIEVIKNTFDDAKVMELVKPKAGSELNGMTKHARNLNSLPKCINTIVLVPAFLGFILPKIVYGITAKNREKHEQAKLNRLKLVEQNNNSQFQQTRNNKIPNTTFKQIKHNS